MSKWIIYHIIAIWIALVIDRLIGDPEHLPHPVRWFGTLISFFDQKMNKGNKQKRNGLIAILIMQIIVFASTIIIVFFGFFVHPVAGIIIEGILISTTISPRNLKEAALAVYEPLINNDITQARYKLSWIVGRDTDQLSISEIVRGTIETVSENTSDGVTAPLFYAFIGGAPFAVLYRFVNTCDSMLGYQNKKYERFGFASAKLDDIWNYIPARMTGLLTLVIYRCSFYSLSERIKKWKMYARCHPSPNSGYLEAATALLLGIQLGGINTYKGKIDCRPFMGDDLVEKVPIHIVESISIMYRTTLFFAVILTIIGGGIVATTCTWC